MQGLLQISSKSIGRALASHTLVTPLNCTRKMYYNEIQLYGKPHGIHISIVRVFWNDGWYSGNRSSLYPSGVHTFTSLTWKYSRLQKSCNMDRSFFSGFYVYIRMFTRKFLAHCARWYNTIGMIKWKTATFISIQTRACGSGSRLRTRPLWSFTGRSFILTVTVWSINYGPVEV